MLQVLLFEVPNLLAPGARYLGRDKGEVLRRDDLVGVDVVLHHEARAGVLGRAVPVLRHLLHSRVIDVRRSRQSDSRLRATINSWY